MNLANMILPFTPGFEMELHKLQIIVVSCVADRGKKKPVKRDGSLPSSLIARGTGERLPAMEQIACTQGCTAENVCGSNYGKSQLLLVTVLVVSIQQYSHNKHTSI